VRCFYAVKCNSEPELLNAFHQLGSSFEIASCAELQMLQKLGVDPEKLLYSNTVKPAAHIAESFAAGLWRYAFDSEGELYKLARHAPGSAVYVRLRVDDSTSLFPRELLRGARPGPLAGLQVSGGLVMLLGSGPTLLAVGLAAELHGTRWVAGSALAFALGSLLAPRPWPAWNATPSPRRSPGRPSASAWSPAGRWPPGTRPRCWPPSCCRGCA
jgi:hypothetical protein